MAVFLWLPQFHITLTIIHRLFVMEAESSKQEKEGLEALITLMKSGGCKMDGGEGGGTSNNKLDYYLGSTPHVHLMTLTTPKSSSFLLCVIAGAKLLRLFYTKKAYMYQST